MNKNYIMPYPYEAYSILERRYRSFDDFKKIVYSWVNKNFKFNKNGENTDIIRNHISSIPDSEITIPIKEWLYNHITRIGYSYDFSGIDFGVILDFRLESIYMRHAHPFSETDCELYPGYDYDSFSKMNILDQLEWLDSRSEFIPLKSLPEIFDSYSDSHKWSHIKKDKMSMDKLRDYLDKCDFYPSDNVYYYIRYNMNMKTKVFEYYLERDLILSPRKNKNPSGI